MSGPTTASRPPAPGDPGFLEAWSAAWSASDPAALLEMYSPDTLYVDVGSAASYQGRGELEGFFAHMLKFARDSRIVFHNYAGDAGSFASEWTWSGTAQGRLMLNGQLLERSAKRFAVEGVAFCTRAEAGLIASHKDYYDMRALLGQLGLADPRGPA